MDFWALAPFSLFALSAIIPILRNIKLCIAESRFTDHLCSSPLGDHLLLANQPPPDYVGQLETVRQCFRPPPPLLSLCLPTGRHPCAYGFDLEGK